MAENQTEMVESQAEIPANNDAQPAFELLDATITGMEASKNASSTLYKFAKDEHVRSLLNNIRLLWHQNQLIDVHIASSEKVLFHYHGIVLAGYSSIFKNILTNGNMQWFQGVLAPRDVETKSLDALKNCLYNPGKFLLDMEQACQRNPKALIEFASFFGLEEIAVNAFIDLQRVLDNWNEMFDQRCLTFSLLQTGESEIPCHGPILAACSPNFRDIVVSEPENPLHMLYYPFKVEGFATSTIEELIKFVYSATLEIDSESVTKLLFASCTLRILAAAKACCDFIKNNLHPESCISFLIVASTAKTIANDGFCLNLYHDIERFIIDNFAEVMITDEFKQKMKEEFIVKYISKADLVKVKKNSVIKALLDWHSIDVDGRTGAIGRLLALVSSLKDQRGLSNILNIAASQNRPKLNYLEEVAGTLLNNNQQLQLAPAQPREQ